MRYQYLVVFALASCIGAGCRPPAADSDKDALARGRIHVAPAVLDTYAGTYRLASGAHFPVVRDGERLLAGAALYELLPQTTRHFSSNHLPGEFHFERSAKGATTLRRRLAKRDSICPRIDPQVAKAPSRLVAVNEHQLRMLIAGSGGPTIVLEDGIGNGIELQAELQAELAKLSTTVSYDHAGTGGSDPGPFPRDATRIAHELRLALHSAGLAPPFVLIGGSIGAEYIRIFAAEFPEETSGLILIDPTPQWDRLIEWAAIHAPSRIETYRQLVLDGDALMDRLMSVQEPGRAAEWDALETTRAMAQRCVLSPEIQIVQITGAGGRETNSIMDDKIRFFDDWLEKNLPQARHVLARNSGHAVPITDRQLVLDEVEQLLVALRRQKIATPHESGVLKIPYDAWIKSPEVTLQR